MYVSRPVALALREQMLPVGDVPVAEHDKKMDMIVTPDGSIADDSALGSEVSGILKTGAYPLFFHTSTAVETP